MWPDCSGPHCRLTVYFLREQWIVIFFFFLFSLRKFLGGRYWPREEMSSGDMVSQAVLCFRPSMPAPLPASPHLSQRVPGSRLLSLGVGRPLGRGRGSLHYGCHLTP